MHELFLTGHYVLWETGGDILRTIAIEDFLEFLSKDCMP